jgi:hypothetical protein
MEIVIIGLIVLLLARRNQVKPPAEKDYLPPPEQYPYPDEKNPIDLYRK